MVSTGEPPITHTLLYTVDLSFRIRKRLLVGPYSRAMLRARSSGRGAFL